MTFEQELGDNIRAARLMQGMHQRDLAQKVGISDSYVSMIENAIRRPSVRLMSLISNVTNTSLDALVPEVIPESHNDPNQTDIFDVLEEE